MCSMDTAMTQRHFKYKASTCRNFTVTIPRGRRNVNNRKTSNLATQTYIISCYDILYYTEGTQNGTNQESTDVANTRRTMHIPLVIKLYASSWGKALFVQLWLSIKCLPVSSLPQISKFKDSP